MNKVLLIGNLASDPMHQYTQGGKREEQGGDNPSGLAATSPCTGEAGGFTQVDDDELPF